MPDVGGIAGERLQSFIERIERLEEEKRALGDDIKEVYAEAKGTGFDTKIMRQIIKIRKMDKDDLDEQESLLDVYKRALGMLPDAEPASRGCGIAIADRYQLSCRAQRCDECVGLGVGRLETADEAGEGRASAVELEARPLRARPSQRPAVRERFRWPRPARPDAEPGNPGSPPAMRRRDRFEARAMSSHSPFSI